MQTKGVKTKEQETQLRNGICPNCDGPVKESGNAGSGHGEHSSIEMHGVFICKKCSTRWIIGKDI